jgi:hypothetical protein
MGKALGNTSFACMAEDEDFQTRLGCLPECDDYADARFCAAEAQCWTWFIDSGWRAVRRLNRTWSQAKQQVPPHRVQHQTKK